MRDSANNVKRERGDTYAEEFTIQDPETLAAEDITGASFLLTVDPERYPDDDTNNLFQITGVIVDATTGRVGFAPSTAQADNVGNYFYDIQMVDAGGGKRTVGRGRWRLVQDITKD